MAKIMIDAGHGGTDGGAVYNGRLEKDDNLKIALKVGELLSQNGFDVEYTRVTDTYDSPTEKARKANQSGADYFVSFHRNSSPIPNQYSGVETLVYDKSGIKLTLAENINEGLEAAGFANLGVEERPNLAVLRRTSMPAVLVEVGFINNERDNELLDKNFAQVTEEIANAISQTITGRGISTTGTDDSAQGNSQGTGGAGGMVTYPSGAVQKPNNTVQNPMNAAQNPMNTVQNPMNAAQNPVNTEQYEEEKYRVQVGLFRNYQNAANQAYGLQVLGYPVEIVVNGPYFAVWVGQNLSLDEGAALEQELQQMGYDTLLVTQ